MGLRYLPCYIDRDEMTQVKAIARWRAEESGEDADEAVRRAVEGLLREERAYHARFVASSQVGADLASGARIDFLRRVPEASRVTGLRPARVRSEKERVRFLRNQMIFCLSLVGFSRRQIADVFEIHRNGVAEITEKIQAMLI